MLLHHQDCHVHPEVLDVAAGETFCQFSLVEIIPVFSLWEKYLRIHPGGTLGAVVVVDTPSKQQSKSFG
jgi:hypothetical protein